jgi:hypothetical protein
MTPEASKSNDAATHTLTNQSTLISVTSASPFHFNQSPILQSLITAIMSRPSQPHHVDLQFRGHIEGLTYLDKDSKPVCRYFGGVPYALPPLGPFRFQKPRSLPACYRYGTRVNPARFTGRCGVCPQPGAGETLDDSESGWDEDCLQSNVWVPIGEPPAGGMYEYQRKEIRC